MSRNAALIARLIESRLDFIVADFPQANRFTIHILGAVAEYETKLISERIKAALAIARSRGRLPQRYAPKEWRIYLRRATIKSHAVVGERTMARARALMPLLIKLRDEGRTLNGIAAELDRLEIQRLRNGASWKGETVRRIFERVGERPPSTRPIKRRVRPSCSQTKACG